MKSKWIIMLVVTLSVFCLLWGCGGGSSSPTAQPSGAINTDLKGKVILGDEGWALDLSTGNYSRVPGVEAWDKNPNYLGIATVRITASPFSDERIVETVSNCQHDPNYSLNKFHCVKIHSNAGNLIKSILYDADIQDPVKISRDGKYMAITRLYDGVAGDLYLEIHDIDRNQIISYNIVANISTAFSFEWLPNNRIVYAVDQSIYVTPSLSAHGNPIIQFNQSDGRPMQLTAGPLGERVAFMLVKFQNTVATEGHVWTMDINGNDLKRLAIVPGAAEPMVNYPTWSPDGNWILVIEGAVSGSSTISPGSPGNLYAVPSNGMDVPLTKDGSTTSAIPVYSRFGQVLGTRDDLDTVFLKSGELFWVPKN